MANHVTILWYLLKLYAVYQSTLYYGCYGMVCRMNIHFVFNIGIQLTSLLFNILYIYISQYGYHQVLWFTL